MPQPATSQPNVIWIITDQHRGQATGYAGDPNLSTPNLDRLAAEGVNFSRAVSGFPLCCPFRGSMLTGRYPHHCVPGHEYRMPPEQPTIAQPLKQAGYHTAYFGKWHVDGFHESEGRAAMHIIPPERRGGFDLWVGYENNNSQWDCWVHGGAGDSSAPAFHRRLPGYETDALTDFLLTYLDEQAGQAPGQSPPFFAVLSVQPPHDPYVAPAEWLARHTPAQITLRPNVPAIPRVIEQARRELAGYYAMIENTDWNIGRVLAKLDESGLADRTHVVFFSDHGDMHGSHGMFRKTNPWEESIRIPFLISGLRTAYAHRCGDVTAPINHVDIAPTTLGLCGIAVPDWMEGADYSGHRLRDTSMGNEPDSAYLQCVIPTGHGDSVDRPWRGVVTRDGWKYVALEAHPWLLYNLNEDPFEQANLALNPRFRAERRKLQERLAAWISDTGDQFALPQV
jgi:arylsulfatase A-like enzyme